MTWLKDVWDFVVDNADTIVPAVTGIVGNKMAQSANDRAAEKQIQGANEAAAITTQGIADALNIDLDTVELLKETLGDRFESVTKLLMQAPADYRQDILSAVVQSGDLTTDGVNRLEGDLGDIGQEYGGRMGQALDEASALLRDGAMSFDEALGQVSQKYGIDMAEIGQAYAKGMGDVGAAYKGDVERLATGIEGTMSGLAGDVEGAYGRAGEKFQPLADAGAEAMGLLRQTAGGDASKLTPSQQRTLDKVRRSSINNLAATGMRGAGRAGIAAVNDAEAGYRADAEDQNQRRIDQAINSLFGAGSSATGNIANLITGGASAGAGLRERGATTGLNLREKGSSLVANLDAQTVAKLQAMGVDVAQLEASLSKAGADANLATERDIADLGYKTGTDVARTLGDLSRVVAGSRFDNTKGIAANLLSANNTAAERDYSTTQNLASQSGDYYDRLMSIGAGEGSLRSGAVTRTAAAKSAAKQGQSIVDAQRTIANGQLSGDTAGVLASVFAQPRRVAPAAASVG
jgi:hypothetical protein